MRSTFNTLSFCLLFLTVQVKAVQYHPPSNHISFDITRLRLDVNQIAELSHFLSLLTQRKQEFTAIELRANAMLLSLAIQLDSTNELAKELNKSYTAQKSIKPLDDSLISDRLSRTLLYSRFLNQSKSLHSKKVALMIRDAIKQIWPNLTSLKEHQLSLSRWRHLHKLSHYQQREEATTEKDTKSNSPTTFNPPIPKELKEQ